MFITSKVSLGDLSLDDDSAMLAPQIGGADASLASMPGTTPRQRKKGNEGAISRFKLNLELGCLMQNDCSER